MIAGLAIGQLAAGCGTTAQKLHPEKTALEEVEACDYAASKKMSAPAPSGRAMGMALSQDAYVQPSFNTEEYDHVAENEFKDAKQNPLSTFSIDVDTASYANVRRFITGSQMPPIDAVRIEEMINYFDYDYPQPNGSDPFSVITEISGCPWNAGSRLVHIGLQGRSLDYSNLKPSNLVFLIDSSGSMQDANKLPLLKQSLKLLLGELSARDRVAVVAYAGSAGLVLPSTPASRRDAIIAAMDQLQAGGSTAGGAGLSLAYKVAGENLIAGGNNRVILCTDGDFNVGVSSTGDLVRMMEKNRKSGIYLTICGFGMGNYKDGRMEQISRAGNGNYFYIDSIKEARKVFVTQMRANMFTIAKDVKIQIEFNPSRVKAYRLVGYETRVMANEDFNNDLKDAGELGAGHTVTALYEIVPAGSRQKVNTTDPLKYQQTVINPDASGCAEVMTVKLRYKHPRMETSRLITATVTDPGTALGRASENFRFSAAVAGFGMILRDSKYVKDLSLKDVRQLARGAMSKDKEGYRAEFIGMIETCALLKK
ncbi:MAG: von Willebrand factor type A domain-containing protein [Spirochaetes bacterium]|nr:von Willebrand factor type A domain-containing protein [Spirochaetota bacterium]